MSSYGKIYNWLLLPQRLSRRFIFVRRCIGQMEKFHQSIADLQKLEGVRTIKRAHMLSFLDGLPKRRQSDSPSFKRAPRGAINCSRLAVRAPGVCIARVRASHRERGWFCGAGAVFLFVSQSSCSRQFLTQAASPAIPFRRILRSAPFGLEGKALSRLSLSESRIDFRSCLYLIFSEYDRRTAFERSIASS